MRVAPKKPREGEVRPPLSQKVVAGIGLQSNPALRRVDYDHFMSKTDASELLDLGDTQGYRLLRDIVPKKGSRQRVVPLQRVPDLAAKHRSATELGARRGVQPQRAFRQGIAAGLPDLGLSWFCRTAAEKPYYP